ncbi:MAG: DUF1214 domain-containing protein [Tannerella sp.]|jgi:hypothetical protein|nr:DUF1214 domain-containing protein [Tannerella sp.]
MKKLKILSFLAIALLLSACGGSKSKQEITPRQAKELAKEAYIYAFPAVEHNKGIWAVLVKDKTPFNQFFANTQLFDPQHTSVVSPNNDTFYGYAICDIRNEPVVITIPKIEKRYFSFQICDIFTNCPEYISTLATGNGPGNYMLARSDWQGKTPEGIAKVIRVPATVVFTLARTQVFGPQDKEAAVLSTSYKVVPLSTFEGTTAPAGVTPLVWPAKPYDSKTGDIEGFFKEFNFMVQYQILSGSDKALMDKYAAIGLAPGKEFSKSEFKPEIWTAIEAGANEAKKEIEAKTTSIGKSQNGWNFSPGNAGRWGTDYMTNAAAAWKYIYVNTPEEAIYPTANVDNEGNKFSGANKYTLTFTREEIPQVKFFWSLTMYNDKGFFVANPLNRYNIKNIDKLTYGKDGSLTLYIQKDNPGKAKESNWLPTPDGQFYMILRMYGPSEDAIKGKTVIPAVVKTK